VDEQYALDIIADLRGDVAAKHGLPSGNARAITCCYPGMVAVLNHIDSLTLRLSEQTSKLEKAVLEINHRGDEIS
jgi:hypothetical protein